MRSLVAAALLASGATGSGSCAYEELVPSRYVGPSAAVAGWGQLEKDGAVRTQGAVAVATASGATPAAVLLAADGSVRLHVVDSVLPRYGTDPSMTESMFWTLPTAEAVASGASALEGVSDDDAVLSTAEQGITGAALGDISALVPGATGSGVAGVRCNATLSASGELVSSCADAWVAHCSNTSWGKVHDTAVAHWNATDVDAWVATDAGLVRVLGTEGAAPACTWAISSPEVTGGWPVRAVTVAPATDSAGETSVGPSGTALPGPRRFAAAGTRVVAGGAWRLWVLDGASGAVTHWEWATNTSSGQGGAVSADVTALASDWDTGVVYVGTSAALDVLYPNGTLGRIDGYNGLPYAPVTSLAVQVLPPLPPCPTTAGPAPPCASSPHADAPSTRLLVGTTAGLALADITPALAAAAPARRIGAPALADAPAAPLPVAAWTWRYMYLERYAPGPSVSGIAAFGNDPASAWPLGHDGVPAAAFSTAAAPLAPSPADPAPAGDYGRHGLTWLERQSWTLEAKAARMRQVQTRHSRHGMVAECSLAQVGNLSSCSNHPSDNNGLWTSLVSSAYLLEHAITGSARAAQDAQEFLQGLGLLIDVTGIPGLMARSCIAPGEPRPPGGKWFNSTAPAYKGWSWKGDTSSDEVAGHTMGWAVAIAHLPETGGPVSQQAAAEYLVDIATYVTKNGFILLDGDGQPTRWGNWAPSALNHNRSWTDERGVNALEILSLLASATAAAPALPDGGAAALPVLSKGWEELTNATNAYPSNLRNLKIETPCDDNYSDDELTALPFYAWLAAAPGLPGPDGSSPADVQACLAGLDRWYGQMAPLRSDLWGAITAGAASARATVGPVPSFDFARAAADARWNLESWPLEQIEWTTRNSHRQDVQFYQYGDRSGRFDHDSLRVLPANERSQGRWNGNPHDLDGGSGGMQEMDAGVWLLPYWLGRFHGLVA